MTTTIGIDIGFGFTKATNGSSNVIFKSIFGEAPEIQYREQFVRSPNDELFLHVDADGNSYFVGELAERQSNVRSFTLDQDQLITDFTKIMTIAALSQVADKAGTVRVVSGLPISYYRRHRETIANLIKGQHRFNVYDSAGHPVPVSATVTHVRVIPQPFGALFNALLNDRGEVGDKSILNGKIGIIDVGFRTTDYSLADRTRYSERGSKTTDSGMSKAFAVIATHLKEQTGINVELYRLYNAVMNGSIKIRGKAVNLKQVADAAMDKLASSIAVEAERLWADDWDMDEVIITGGGGAALVPYLKSKIQGELRLPPTEAGESRFANVRGYWKYGHNLWDRAASSN